MSDNARIHHDEALPEDLVETLAARGLEVRLANDSRAASDPWLEAVRRGFLDSEGNELRRESHFTFAAQRRRVGVYDSSAPQPEVPVGTFASWVDPITLPGGVAVETCAISSVTVAPTHRRRGILAALMASELRAAAALGLPLASLTVSESGIYGRFGFGRAVQVASWSIDVRRAGVIPGDAPGRIDFISREAGLALAPALHERARRGRAGELAMPGGHWASFFGLRPDSEKGDQLRVAQYRDASGEVMGLVLYRVSENEADYAASTLDVSLLVTASDEARLALWRFVLSMDLIGTVHASELPLDEPLWWLLGNPRAATITVRDHEYVRVLDVPAALGARRYAAVDTLLVEVADPLGIAGGRFVLETGAEGTGTVRPLAAGQQAPGTASLSLDVEVLGALLLGGVSAVALAAAGRMQSSDAARVDRVFSWPLAPQLSYWY